MNTFLDNLGIASAALLVAVSLYFLFWPRWAVTAPTRKPGEKAQQLARACGDQPIDRFLWQRSHDEILDALLPDEGKRGADLALAHRELTREVNSLPAVNAIGLLIAGRCGADVPKPGMLRAWFLRGLGRRARNLILFANGDPESPHVAELAALSEFVGPTVMNRTADELRAGTGCEPGKSGPPAAGDAAPRIDRKSMAPIVAAAMSRCDKLAETIRFGSWAFDYQLGLLKRELAGAGATLADVGLHGDRLERARRLCLPLMAKGGQNPTGPPLDSEYCSLLTVASCRGAALKHEVYRRRHTDRVFDVEVYRLVDTALELSASGFEIDLYTLVGLMKLALDATRTHLVDLQRAAERHVLGSAEILEEVRAHVGEVYRAIYGEGSAAAA